MTEEIRNIQPPRTRRRLGASLTAGLALAAGAAGFAAGQSEPAAVQAQALQAPATLSRGAPVASYSHIVEKVAPAVVTVRVEHKAAPMDTSLSEAFRDFFGQQMPRGRMPGEGRRVSGLGSGVVVRADGYIVTNAHVVGDAERVRVEFADLRTLDAEVVGSDEATDLAVLKVDADELPTVALGDSAQVKVGDVVLALGNPLGVGQTVTMGIVSAKGRTTGVGDGSYQDFIQTDAPINQGNSGGALVNLAGELVGINAQILSRTGGNIGLGFAIPAEMVSSVTEQLITNGVVQRAKLGVVVQGLSAELAEGLGLDEPRGALVSDIEPGSPGAEAGLKPGDVIVAVDGRAVVDSNALRNQIASTKPGSKVTLDVRRDGKPQQLTATLAAQTPMAAEAASAPKGQGSDDTARLGVAVEPLTPQLAARLELPRTTTGLVVTGVDPNGPAASAGIQEGDVITRANDRDVDSVASLRSALEARTDRPAVLVVTREGRNVFVAVPDKG